VNGNVVRDGRVHVCREMCSTCVFRPGNLMWLARGRLSDMVDAARADDAAIICHQTIPTEHDAVCRGFFDRYDTTPLTLAKHLGVVEEVDPPS
jgi:hypothetical protein